MDDDLLPELDLPGLDTPFAGAQPIDCLKFFSELQDTIDEVDADGNSTIDSLKFLSELQDIINEVGADGDSRCPARHVASNRGVPPPPSPERRVCEQPRKKRPLVPRTGRIFIMVEPVYFGGASRRHRAQHLGHFRGEVCLMPVSKIMFLLPFPNIVLGEATCSRSAHGPTSSGFHLGVAVRAHLHLMPSLLQPCRTCFTACASCPVGSSAWLPGRFCLSLMEVIGESRLSSYLVDAAMQVGCGEAAWAGKRQALAFQTKCCWVSSRFC